MPSAANWVASGDINPSRFVTPTGTTNSWKVAQAGAGAEVVGISQEGARDAPIPSASTLAASANQSLQVYGPGDICLLEIAAACSAGALLKSDASGKGTPVTTDKDKYGAIALQDGTADAQKIMVQIRPGHAAV